MYLPAAVLTVGCLLLWRSRAQVKMPPAAPLSSIMPEVRGYTTVQQTFSEHERSVARMSDYVARAYRRDSAVVFTTLVSYYDKQLQGISIHSPRNCLPGSGWQILKPGRREIVVDGSTYLVNGYVLKNGSNVAVAYYWYQGRGRVAANEYVVKWNLIRDAAFFGRTEEALVRVIVPVEIANSSSGEDSYRRAYGIGDQVAARLIHEVNRVMPSMTPGNHGEARAVLRSDSSAHGA